MPSAGFSPFHPHNHCLLRGGCGDGVGACKSGDGVGVTAYCLFDFGVLGVACGVGYM